MGMGVPFPGANRILGAPEGRKDDVVSLRTFTNGTMSVSCWQLDEAEIAEVLRTGKVFVSVISGQSKPPIFVGSEHTVRGLVVAYGGVWKVRP